MATSTIGDLIVWNDATATQVASDDPTSYFRIVDDFVFAGTASPDIGFGWATSAGAVSMIASEANHLGIIQRSTGTSQNTLAFMTIRTFPTTGVIDPASMFDMTWIVRPDTDSTNIHMKIGMTDNFASTAPSNGIYVERLGTDTSWFGVTRSGGSQTRTAALITSAAATWFKFRIRRVNGTTIGFTVNGGSEVTATATIPTAMLHPGNLITNPAAAAPVALDIDLFKLTVYGLNR